MVDNIDVTAGSGTTIAADDVGGALHQRVKVSIGADGTAADWPVGSGNQSAVPRVTLATDSPGVTTPGQAAMTASLPVVIANNQSAIPVDHATTGVGHGVKTVTTAGTDVVLASSTPAKWVIIQAQTDNTSSVAVGATGVDATVATGTGILLAASESVTLPCDNLADIFIDSLVNGEGVRFTYGT